MKKIIYLLLILSAFTIKSFSQCSYTGTPLTQVGTANTFCIDNLQTITTPTVNAGQYVILNVIKGYNYTLSVGNVFSGVNENLTILDAVSNSNVTPAAFTNSANGTSITWTSTLSGQIKVLLSKGGCLNDNSAGGALTLTLNSTTNTQDSQTAFFNDQWIGHIYNWTGSTPPGGNSPAAPSATLPFNSNSYVGYYNVGSETINQGFGGDQVCFPVLSDGVVRTNILTTTFAVRYRMRSTKVGCYLATFSGDDGVRIYIDGVLLFNEWKEQASTTYNNILLNLTGANDIVFDFYENAGQNVVNFNLVPFNAASNTIAATNTFVLSGVSAGLINGSNYPYNGAVINPSLSFQWQTSTDNITFTDISGQTFEDYTPPAITVPSGTVRNYYRRIVKATANTASCIYLSNVVSILTGAFVPCTNSTPSFTQVGGVNTLCIDGSAVNTATVNAGRYVLVNVVKGFNYSFSVGNVFNSDFETLTVINATTNLPIATNAFSVGEFGTNFSWLSTLSGQIKILLSKGDCVHDLSTGGAITLSILNVGNTQDSQATFGTDNWVGHAYNWTGSTPPGGASPSTVSTNAPFNTASYSGYYNVPTETISENFGGDNACFPLLSNGVVRTNLLMDKMIIRYKMRSTKTGCFLGTFSGDDGIRVYVDGNLVFSEWKDQGTTVYGSVLLYLNGNSDIVFDYYENAGGNTVTFNLTPFVAGSNSIAAPAITNICSGATPAILNGSAYTYNGATTNPSISYQWQSSPDDVSFSDISGATSEDYTPSAITSSFNLTTYYRRVVTAVSANATGCFSDSNSVALFTVGAAVNGSVFNDQTICSGTQPADLNLAGSLGNIVKWQKSTNIAFTSPIDIANTTTTLTSAAIGNISTLTYFRAVVQSGSCAVVNSNFATINVSSVTIPGTVSANQSICAGTQPNNLTLSGNTGDVIRWESASDLAFTSPITIANTSTTLTSATIGNLNSTTYFRAVVQITGCAILNSSVATITIASTTWNGTTWSNGIPTITTTAFMTQNFTSSGNLFACSLTVSNNAVVTILPTHNVTLNGVLSVSAGSSFTLNSNANLLQQTNVNNIGNIILKRNSSLLKRLDYTIWSSPVANQNLLAFSPLTIANRFYNYNTDTSLYNAVPSPSTTNFTTGQGNLIRTPNNHPTTPTSWEGQFLGIPNNGNYTYTMTNLGAGKRFNMVGNPYPSTISMTSFVAGNTSNITGTLYFWRKSNSTLTTVPYCTWTAGTFVSNGETEVFNPNGVINSGQGFFVEALNSAITVNYNNSMRVANNNNQFFRPANSVVFNRIWLNATSITGLFSQTAIGYNTNANLGIDEHDGKYFNDGDIAFASIINNDKHAIQGRSLPFDNTDIVPLSFKVTNPGNYTISIDHVDGLFSGYSDILLRDNLLGTTHNLVNSSYDFASLSGTFDSRFELFYNTSILATEPVNFSESNVIVFKNNPFIVVNAGLTNIKSIKIYDISGRKLLEQNNINSNQSKIDSSNFGNQVLVVQITSDSNISINKKIVN